MMNFSNEWSRVNFFFLSQVENDSRSPVVRHISSDEHCELSISRKENQGKDKVRKKPVPFPQETKGDLFVNLTSYSLQKIKMSPVV